MRTLALLVIGIIALTFLLSGPEAGFMRTAQSVEKRAQQIWTTAQPAISRCREGVSAKNGIMAAALVAIELDQTNWLERYTEEFLVRFALGLGMAPPDLSIGPAQIRLSTAQRMQRHSTGLRETFDSLLDTCRSLDLTRQLIAAYSLECANPADNVCRQEIARRFNGQLSFNQANLAYLLIFQAVYSVALADRK